MAYYKTLLHFALLGTFQNAVAFDPSWHTPKHSCTWSILAHSKTLLHFAHLGTLKNSVSFCPSWHIPKNCCIWSLLAQSKPLLQLTHLGTLQNIVTFRPSWHNPNHCYILPILAHSKALLHLTRLGTFHNNPALYVTVNVCECNSRIFTAKKLSNLFAFASQIPHCARISYSKCHFRRSSDHVWLCNNLSLNFVAQGTFLSGRPSYLHTAAPGFRFVTRLLSPTGEFQILG